MAYETLISQAELLSHLGDPDWAIIDCRYYQEEPVRGRLEYQAAHLPGAVYAHLLEDLCSAPIAGTTSRHPWPAAETFSARLSHWGIDEHVQVVVYDNFKGGFAVRLWRMLGWLGHRAVALLDGGLEHWLRQGLPCETGVIQRQPRIFIPKLRPELLVDAETTLRLFLLAEYVLIDTRAERSYTGAKEPTSPTSGHIPGASHFLFTDNLNEYGLLMDVETLRQRYQAILASRQAEQVVCYCTSGVTASLNILVMQHLGLGEARLFPGSWDEWTLDPTRPVEKTTPE